MTSVLIVGLMALAGFLGVRLGSVRAQNATLQAQVDSLKRQLIKRKR
jgi:hypothetical protein